MENKLLVIYVDIDDDLGAFGISTPVIGSENVKKVIDVASKVMPTDSDFNTMVVALNTFDKLKAEGRQAEICIIAGSEKGGIEAQLSFGEKLDEVIRKVSPSGAIVVFDSPEDEKALPIIQSRLPIAGIEKVIVEQSKGVEETYALLARYIKKALTEPRFSRIFLGVPGIILLVLSLMELLGLLRYGTIVVLFIIGIAMIIRGLSIDDIFEKWWENSPIMVTSAILAGIAIIVTIVEGLTIGYQLHVVNSVTVAAFTLNILPLIMLTLIILIAGKAISRFLEKNVKIWHDVLQIATIIVGYYVIAEVLRQVELQTTILTYQVIFTLVISSILISSIYGVLSRVEKRISKV
ncbi:hypothetical protein HS7_17870 [Sulfolobales archaeon HS-7]|nr:hypothetical protein HS7_17870 [Sulfolobales archaeon HS-7]